MYSGVTASPASRVVESPTSTADHLSRAGSAMAMTLSQVLD